jgi:hypothetical protein
MEFPARFIGTCLIGLNVFLVIYGLLFDELLQMDKSEIDAMLTEHDWASDHITSSKDDIEEVFDFIAGNEDQEYDKSLDNLFDNPLSHIDNFISHTKK